MFLRFLKVSGQSLAPVYQDGDFVLVSKIPILFHGLRAGDVVLFQHPRHGKLIKLVDHLESDGKSVYVVGTNRGSVDSRDFGAVPGGMVLGKVILHIPKK